MSIAFRNIDPPPTPSPPSECVVYPSPLVRGEYTLAGWRGEVVNSSKDARHCSVLYIRKYFVTGRQDAKRCLTQSSFLLQVQFRAARLLHREGDIPAVFARGPRLQVSFHFSHNTLEHSCFCKALLPTILLFFFIFTFKLKTLKSDLKLFDHSDFVKCFCCSSLTICSQ